MALASCPAMENSCIHSARNPLCNTGGTLMYILSLCPSFGVLHTNLWGFRTLLLQAFWARCGSSDRVWRPGNVVTSFWKVVWHQSSGAGVPRHLLCRWVFRRCQVKAEVKFSTWIIRQLIPWRQQGLDGVQSFPTFHSAIHPVQPDHWGAGHLLLHQQPHHGEQDQDRGRGKR